MSHNSYQLRQQKIQEGAARDLLELRGERFFTIDDIEQAKSGKLVFGGFCFAVGVVVTIVIIVIYNNVTCHI